MRLLFSHKLKRYHWLFGSLSKQNLLFSIPTKRIQLCLSFNRFCYNLGKTQLFTAEILPIKVRKTKCNNLLSEKLFFLRIKLKVSIFTLLVLIGEMKCQIVFPA